MKLDLDKVAGGIWQKLTNDDRMRPGWNRLVVAVAEAIVQASDETTKGVAQEIIDQGGVMTKDGMQPIRRQEGRHADGRTSTGYWAET